MSLCINYFNRAQAINRSCQETIEMRTQCLPCPLKCLVDAIAAIVSIPFIALRALCYYTEEEPPFTAKTVQPIPENIRITAPNFPALFETYAEGKQHYIRLPSYQGQLGQLTHIELPYQFRGKVIDNPSYPIYLLAPQRACSLEIPQNCTNVHKVEYVHLKSTPLFVQNSQGELLPFKTVGNRPIHQCQPIEPDGQLTPLIMTDHSVIDQKFSLLPGTPIVNLSTKAFQLNQQGVTIEPGQTRKEEAAYLKIVTTDKTFLVHKPIAEQSRTIKERNNNSEDNYLSTDIPSQGMEMALTFLYRGTAPLTLNNIKDALKCAVYLKHQGFLIFCAHAILKMIPSMDRSTFFDLITLAHELKLDSIKGHLTLYAASNFKDSFGPPNCVKGQYEKFKRLHTTATQEVYDFVADPSTSKEDRALIYKSVNPYCVRFGKYELSSALLEKRSGSHRDPNIEARDSKEDKQIQSDWTEAFKKSELYGLDLNPLDVEAEKLETLMLLGTPQNPFTLRVEKRK